MARRGDGIYLRGRTWRLDFRHDGRRYIVRLGRNINRTAAQDIASVKRAAILKGEVGIAAKAPANPPLDKAVSLYLDTSTLKPLTRQRYQSSLRRLAGYFPGKKIMDLSPLALEKYKRERQGEGVEPATINRDLEILRNLCNRLVAWGKLARNPVRLVAAGREVKPGEVSKLKEPEGRVRYLTAEEEQALLEACTSPQLRAVILLGIHAGLRIPSEALSLTWDGVDLKRRTLTVVGTHSKTSKTRTVPINSVLWQALQSLRMDRNGGPIFVSQGRALRSIRTAFDTARKKAGLGEDVTPHVMRHTFASRLVMEGVDLRTVQELGGWSDLKMVQRYSHVDPRRTAEAVERLAAHFTPVFTPPERVVALNPHGPVAQMDRAEVS